MNTCATRGCDRPATAVICGGCVQLLTGALGTLAAGPVQRVRTHVTAYYIGQPPVTEVIIDRLPGLLADLDDTLARITKTGGLSTGSVLATDESPLIFHTAASSAAASARAILSTWVTATLRTGARLTLPGRAGQILTTTLAAAWLARHPAELAMLPDAAQLVDDITGLVHRIRALVDRAPDLTYVGPCDATLDDGDTTRACGRDLYGHLHTPEVRCPACGTTYPLAERRDWLLLKVADQLATASEITRALPALLGDHIPSSTIRRWASEGRVDQHPARNDDPLGRPLYRVGDIIDLAATRRPKDMPRMTTPNP